MSYTHTHTCTHTHTLLLYFFLFLWRTLTNTCVQHCVFCEVKWESWSLSMMSRTLKKVGNVLIRTLTWLKHWTTIRTLSVASLCEKTCENLIYITDICDAQKFQISFPQWGKLTYGNSVAAICLARCPGHCQWAKILQKHADESSY